MLPFFSSLVSLFFFHLVITSLYDFIDRHLAFIVCSSHVCRNRDHSHCWPPHIALGTIFAVPHSVYVGYQDKGRDKERFKIASYNNCSACCSLKFVDACTYQLCVLALALPRLCFVASVYLLGPPFWVQNET